MFVLYDSAKKWRALTFTRGGRKHSEISRFLAISNLKYDIRIAHLSQTSYG